MCNFIPCPETYLIITLHKVISQIHTVNVLYLACTIFGGVFFHRFSAIYREFDLVVDLCPFIETFVNAHLAVYLIWQRDSTAKGAKKNISPNVIRLQYTEVLYK